MKVELKNISSIFNGKTPSKAEQRDMGFPVLKIKDIDENGFFKGKFDCFVDQELADGLLKKHVRVGDILILNAAHNSKYVGSKKCFVSEDFAGALATGEWTIVRPNQNKVLPKFLYFILDTAEFQFQLQNVVKGIHLYPKDLNEIKIFCPSLEEQKRIVRELDTADALRQKRKQAIALLDDYLKAVFLEMFGDPVANTKGWKIVEIDSVCTEIVDCVNRTAPLADHQTEYKMIRTTNVKNGRINFNEVRYVTEETFKVWTRRSVPKYGDIIFTREAPVGDAAMVNFSDKVFLGQRTMQYRPDITLIDSQFLLYQLLGEGVKKQMDKLGSGSTVKHLSVLDCKKFQIQLPDVILQKKFSAISQKVEDIKESMDIQLDQLDESFNVLTQKVFS